VELFIFGTNWSFNAFSVNSFKNTLVKHWSI